MVDIVSSRLMKRGLFEALARESLHDGDSLGFRYNLVERNRVSPATGTYRAFIRSLAVVVQRVNECRAVPESFAGPTGAPIRAPGVRRQGWRGHESVASLLHFEGPGLRPGLQEGA